MAIDPSETRNEATGIIHTVMASLEPDAIKHQSRIRFAEELIESLDAVLSKAGIHARLEIQGSFAKNTYLPRDSDIDLFMVIDQRKRNDMSDVLVRLEKAISEAVFQGEPIDYERSYAEHPYLRLHLKQSEIDLVPCFDAGLSGELATSVDRTPLHTEYVNTHLGTQGRGEVRVLKKFMKSIGVYGAETRTGGFHGYLCELLVLRYGSFYALLLASQAWREGERIYLKELGLLHPRLTGSAFGESPALLLIDPTDPSRNTAAALTLDKFELFQAASRAFLTNPSEAFFEKPTISPPAWKVIRDRMEQGAQVLLCVSMPRIDRIDDVVWGRLGRFANGLRRVFTAEEFQVDRVAPWATTTMCGVFIAFEADRRSQVTERLGPPVTAEKSEDYLRRFTDDPKVVAGPFVKNGRWCVRVSRSGLSALTFARRLLDSDIHRLAMSDRFRSELTTNGEVAVVADSDEILQLYETEHEFADSLFRFVENRPHWIKHFAEQRSSLSCL